MVQSNPFLDLGAWMFRYLGAQMLKCLDTWILGCSEAHVDCSKHCALPYNQLLSHSCPLCYNSWRIRHIVKKNMSDIHVVPLQCHIFHCTKVPLRWLGYVYFHLHIWRLCIRSESRCICSARHLWPSPPGREPTMESGGIVPNPTSSSSSTHCRGIWQCKESSSHSAAALLQCRETRHAQNVPPFSHSGGGGRPLLPVTGLNHRIFSILDIRFTHGRFYRLICPLCVFCNQLLSVSQFFSPEREIHSLLPEAKCGRNGNADLVFFGRFVQILNLI